MTLMISKGLPTIDKSLDWVDKGAFEGTFYDLQLSTITWGIPQTITDLTTFRKAEAVNATPQDLSTVLRWAGGVRFLAGPATLD